jgi:hypothetical protein
MKMQWKRFNYLFHRWIGIVLGVVVLAWFISGIVMMYYPYPVLTESKRLALLDVFEPTTDLVGFRTAYEAALADFRQRGYAGVPDPETNLVGGRLMLWDGRLAYQLWHQREYHVAAVAVVDASSGKVLTPISAETAARVARAVVGPLPRVSSVELLPRGDYYMFHTSYHLEEFPAYAVRFADSGATTVYLGKETGNIDSVADRVTRLMTWIGRVPHWLYFMWLYQHSTLWTWLNYILPSVTAVAALSGIVLGLYQLFPRRGRGDWRASGYQGMSKWHHIAGVVFGLMVFTWTLSGLFEMMGVDPDPREGQAEKARNGPVRWQDIRVSEADALQRLRGWVRGPLFPIAIDLTQLDGRPGYHFRLRDGRSFWVDAVDGTPRGDLAAEAAKVVAYRVLGNGPSVLAVERISEYDYFYYARHGREMPLPAWRIVFDDPQRSVVYLGTVTGLPVGFVDADTRLWRWLRHAMHSLDFPGLVNKRPVWDLVVLPLMIGGTLSAITGVWLMARRLRRMAR